MKKIYKSCQKKAAQMARGSYPLNTAKRARGCTRRAFSGKVAGPAVTRGMPNLKVVVYAGGGKRGRGEAMRAVDALRFRNDGALRVGQFVAWQIGGGVSSEKSQGRRRAVFVCHFWGSKPAAKPVLASGGHLLGLGASV